MDDEESTVCMRPTTVETSSEAPRLSTAAALRRLLAGREPRVRAAALRALRYIVARASAGWPAALELHLDLAVARSLDRNLERAAMNLGASPLRTFWEVTFPVLRPGFLVGGLFAFIHSFDEAVVAIFISGQAASTLPRKMFDSIRIEADPIVSVVSTLLFAAVLASLEKQRAGRSTMRP